MYDREAEETIEVRPEESDREEEVEEVPAAGTGKERELTTDQRLDLVAEEVVRLQKENAKLAQQLKRVSAALRVTPHPRTPITFFETPAPYPRTPAPPLFGREREGTVPPPAYHGMPDIKGYKPIAPKPYDGTTDVEGFLVEARLHLKWYESSLTEDYQKVMAISQLLAGKVLDWFEPILSNYLTYFPDDCLDATNYVFSDYRHFEERMRALYEDTDK
ncbi:hypothetical protein DL767_010349 [Monosporascus sp. MG133]|nr:hypothetical protein DL767_010349 [Monosporascus sp. MG133]